MSRFFIDRPIFAWVIAIVIMLAGALAIDKLPVEQYPTIAPPSVRVQTTYPGASAKTVEDSVTQVLEQNMTGIDNLLYMSSQSDSSGSVSITLNFTAGTDADTAQVQVQNKVQQALSSLPQAVQDQGVTVEKANSSFLMVVGLISEDGKLNQSDISDYLVTNIKEPLSRLEGVGSVRVFGAQYSMRIWLDPNKLNSFSLTPSDVTSAIENQNTQFSVGQLGATPSVQGQQLNATITAQGRLTSADEFKKILLKVNTDGSQVRLGDVARVELGAESYAAVARLNGKPSSGIAISLATGANALDTATKVKAKMDELSQYFPSGLKLVYPYDTTTFVKISISEVAHTLVEAIILVFFIMYLFLQNFRATLIPTIAVPVVLLGTFGIMAVFGYSINTLTMFGLVLAIGLLVDDAIVVVENVERVMSEEGLSPLEATRKSMDQITGALIGIALVLSAVFVPMAFFSGSTGAIYRQFSVTIVSAMALSVVVALILTPALCATILKPIAKGDHGIQKGFFGWFNHMFERNTRRYRTLVGKTLQYSGRMIIIYVILIGGLGYLFKSLPTSFLPDEDQGALMVMVQLPTGATQERTLQVLDQVSDYFNTAEKDNIETVFTIAGFSFAGSGQNMGLGFVKLKDWSQRKAPGSDSMSIAGRAMGHFMKVKDASIFALNLPAIRELGNATGFDLFLKDQGGLGHEKLLEARNQLLGMAAKDPILTRVRPNGMEDTPEFNVNIDYEKAMALGLSVSDINSTLSIAWGSKYVNDFIDRGRVKSVYVMADAPYRMQPEDLNLWHVKNSDSQMVPFSAFAKGSWTYGSPSLQRYNGSSAIEIVGEAADGYSSGQAMDEMAKLISQLPAGIGFEWTGLSYQEQVSGSQAPALYAISLLVVFLCLAALYESWSIPFSVMLIVPLGVFGALVAASLRMLSNDIFFQVGLLTTIGLSAKNAILIVEFAKELFDKGMGLKQAVIEASRIRLRPILMTSLAFLLGVFPLVISTGAGANGRHAIGTGVTGGMIAATVLAIFYVPCFFVLVMKYFSKYRKSLKAQTTAENRHD